MPRSILYKMSQTFFYCRGWTWIAKKNFCSSLFYSFKISTLTDRATVLDSAVLESLVATPKFEI
jgi:hypothetical protein